MAVQNDSGFKAFQAGTDLIAWRAVAFESAGVIVYATDEQSTIGITQHDCSDGEHCTVKLIGAPGTFKVTLDGALTFAVTTDERGPLLYQADDGKFSTTGTKVIMNAMEAGDGDGAIIEAAPYNIPN